MNIVCRCPWGHAVTWMAQNLDIERIGLLLRSTRKQTMSTTKRKYLYTTILAYLTSKVVNQMYLTVSKLSYYASAQENTITSTYFYKLREQ